MTRFKVTAHVPTFCLVCILFPTLDSLGPNGANWNLGMPFPIVYLKGLTLSAESTRFVSFSWIALFSDRFVSLGLAKVVALFCEKLASQSDLASDRQLHLERLFLSCVLVIALQNFPAFTNTLDSMAGFMASSILRAVIVYGTILIVVPATIIFIALRIRRVLKPQFPRASWVIAWCLGLAAFLSYSVIALL